MSRKSKGINAEREIVKLFAETGQWLACRVAGSGSSSYPSPDIIAGNKIRKLAIECKAVKGQAKYFSEDEIEQLKTFANTFGAEAWIGVRFDRLGWRFFAIEEMKKTPAGYGVSFDLATLKGLVFDELIG